MARKKPEQNIEAIVNRYDRQELIKGWDQRKLTETSVVVAGGDVVGQYVVMALSALGFGYIELYDKGIPNEENFSSGFIKGSGDVDSSNYRTESISEFAKKINPLIESNGINLDLSRTKNLSVLNKPNIVIDATNDPASKKELMDYCIENKCLFISVSSSDNTGKLGVFDGGKRKSRTDNSKVLHNLLFTDMADKEQDPATGMMVGALAADEARKYVMPMNNEKLIEDIIIHDMHSNKRFDSKKERSINGDDDFSGKKVLMVGAGALGNFVGLGLSLTNLGELVIIDKDIVESTNLNRQPFFYNSVGREKVPALISELKKINPDKKYTGIVDFIDLGFDYLFKKNKPDIIIDCVDNDKARALLNYYSTKYNIPMISSATRYNSGHVNISVPGKTSCLDCQKDIDKYALEGNRARQSQSCIYAPQASVITSNMAIAGMVVCEAKALLNPDKYGDPISFELKYISEDEYRVGTLPLNKDMCDCYKDDEKIENWPKVMGKLYDKKA